MYELPEAIVVAQQVNQALSGKQVEHAIANQSPHKFAWYSGDPAEYDRKLAGKIVGPASARAGLVEICVGDMRLVISTLMRYYEKGQKLPPKHQLLISFTDGTALVCTVQMWGGLFCVGEGETIPFEDANVAEIRPSPLTDRFDRTYFNTLFNEETPKLSAKAFLATEQRIPGVGNGVLQDILWTARIHPRRKMSTLTTRELDAMFKAIKNVLQQMTDEGGRDTEKDLFGNPGGYKTILSKNTVDTRCPVCDSLIIKEAYMGGSIYYCSGCQKL